MAAKYAEAWPAWGYRKIAAMMRADGHQVTNSSVQRALRRRDLLLPQGFRADRKSWAVLRRRVFRDPPTERNRVWQTDFSEFETACGGIWRISAVIDYATKYCLAITVTPASRGVDAVRCIELAVAEAQRVLGLIDLRTGRRGLAFGGFESRGIRGERGGRLILRVAQIRQLLAGFGATRHEWLITLHFGN